MAGGVGQQRPGHPTVVVETTAQGFTSLPSTSCGQMLSRQKAGGTTLVTVGQAAVVTVAVWTGHPEGTGDGKGMGSAFWAVQKAGVMMLCVERINCDLFQARR